MSDRRNDVCLRLGKLSKLEVMAAAEKRKTSMNAYIIEAIKEKMQRDAPEDLTAPPCCHVD